VDYEQLKKENDALRQELGFTRSSKLALVSCTVLAPNAFGFTDAITLNCGQDAGVQEGQAILSQGFVVGKILFVAKNTSTALLATSAKFSTDARLVTSGSPGIAIGSFGSGQILDQLSQNVAVNKGDMVVTAGISDKIPKNIPIGEVGETLSTSNDLFKKTTLISPIDFNTLEFVFVVQQ
jgi:rod shape-determining protein MreC